MLREEEWNKIQNKELFNNFKNIILSPVNMPFIAEILAAAAHNLLSENNFEDHIIYNLCQMMPNLIDLIDINLNEKTYADYLKTTDEFKNLKKLYDELIVETAKLIKSCGDLDIYEIGVLHTLLIKHGIFSKTKHFEYHLYKDDKDYNQSILGARITHGAGICRNIASNLIDVYQQLGFESTFIGCVSGAETSKFGENPKLYSFINYLLNFLDKARLHALVGVKDSNGSLIIDPTNDFIGKTSSNNNEIILLRDASSSYDEFHWKFCLYYLFYHKKYSEKLEQYNNICVQNSYLDIYSSLELANKYEKMFLLLFDHPDYFRDWQDDHMDLIREIDSLDQLLSDYKDDGFDNTHKLSRF